MEQVSQDKAISAISPQGSVALYWDFENLHAGVFKQKTAEDNDYANVSHKPQEALIDVAAVLAFAQTLGTVVINRAFGHWGKFQRYRVPLLEAAADLVQLFPVGANGKNGADIRLCLDVMEDMVRFPHIQTIVIAAGDSDYLALVHKIKATGRKLYGIGGTLSTNQYWAKSCHGFTYYEALVPSNELPVSSDVAQPSVTTSEQNTQGDHSIKNESNNHLFEAKVLVAKAIFYLEQKYNEPWVSKSRIRPAIEGLCPTFHERYYGLGNFNQLLQKMGDWLEIRQAQHDHEICLKRSLFDTPIDALALEATDCLLSAQSPIAALLQLPTPEMPRKPIFDSTPDKAALGQAFILWLKQSLAEQLLSYNTINALIHLIDGRALLVSPKIFQKFCLEYPETAKFKHGTEDTTWHWVQKGFMSLKQHHLQYNGLAIWNCTLQTMSKRGKLTSCILKGFLIDSALIFDTPPPNNPAVRLTEPPLCLETLSS